MIDFGELLPLFLLPAVFLLVFAISGFFIFHLLRFLFKKSSVFSNSSSDFALVSSLLTPAERSFYGVLSQSVGDGLIVVPKVRVADVLKLKSGADRQTLFNKIAMKHFDFVVCDSETFTPRYIVELNDSSHFNQNRKMRDEFLHSICSSAGLPFIQFKAQSGYSPAAISGVINTELTESLT
jgi:hypothetical protein